MPTFVATSERAGVALNTFQVRWISYVKTLGQAIGAALPLEKGGVPRKITCASTSLQNRRVHLSYIAVSFNHFRALQRWALAHDAQAFLDMRDFRVEVRRGADFCYLHPQFLGTADGKLVYSQSLTEAVTGFVGWLPYKPIRWPLSTDKLSFKSFASSLGLRTPRHWSAQERIHEPHVVKRSMGSFGLEVYGPYRSGAADSADRLAAQGPGTAFGEQFVQGRNVKIWYWGASAFHAHVHTYPVVCGDGFASIGELIDRKLIQVGRSRPTGNEWESTLACLEFQQLDLAHRPTAGSEVWVDFRYGRRFDSDPFQPNSDDMWMSLPSTAQAQAHDLGIKIGAELQSMYPVPVLFAVDAVLDEKGDLWWLEVNSNPVLPPTGYPLILSTIFTPDPTPLEQRHAVATQ